MNNEKKIVYLSDKKELAFFLQKATPDFWDKHWVIGDLKNFIVNSIDDQLFLPRIKKYLPKGATILEGGCGRAQLVHAMQYNGYNAFGIDFAIETVKRVKQAVPDLDVRVGDVRNLPIENGILDGYISVGVIEHFWDGYDEIILEMSRTVRQGGYIFVSFPYMSPLRRFKNKLRLYQRDNSNGVNLDKNTFYQFALNPKTVIKKFKENNFVLIETYSFDGIKGFKDEIRIFRNIIQKIYDGILFIGLRNKIDLFLKPFTSHCILLVFQKRR